LNKSSTSKLVCAKEVEANENMNNFEKKRGGKKEKGF
jgi:hypothetical protein